MPVRFRCAYCNQLLGIARRKAGTVVRCPTCAGQVVVPSAEVEARNQPANAKQVQQPIFERSDFEEVFGAIEQPVALNAPARAPEVPAAPAAPAPAGAWGTHAEPAYGAERLDAAAAAAALAPTPAGIVLSPGKATVFMVIAVLAMALAFGAGVLVGKFLL
jgi:hypothetical protein